MLDIRRTILWVIFSFSSVLLWDKWQIHNGKPATFFPSAAISTQKAGTAAPEGAANSANAANASTATAADAPASGAVPSTDATIAANTDVLDLKFSTRGGSLVYAALPAYKSRTDETKMEVLLDNRAGYVYIAQSGLTGNMPNHTTPMHLVGDVHSLAEGQNTLSLRFESDEVSGVKLAKTWTFTRGGYAASVKHEVINNSGAPIDAKLYTQLMRDDNAPAGTSSFISSYTGPVVYSTAGKYEKIDFKDIENDKAKFTATSTDGYIAMVQHYFLSAWILPEGVARTNIVGKEAGQLFRVGAISDLGSIAAGQVKATEVKFFVGPQLGNQLDQTAANLDLVKDYGMLTIIAKPLYWLLEQLHSYLGNWGWAIVALVVLIKIAFYWLNVKAYTSMAKMKVVAPKITEMRERLKDQPQQMQQEMMRIYKEEKVNPMGGCLPMLVQMPIFFALYQALLASVEMRGAPWVLWIHDLSMPDPYYILPVIYTVTMLFQTWLNPKPADPLQAKMMWYMPLAFSVMFLFFPSGLVLYWITNNILTIAQQWQINKSLGVKN